MRRRSVDGTNERQLGLLMRRSAHESEDGDKNRGVPPIVSEVSRTLYATLSGSRIRSYL